MKPANPLKDSGLPLFFRLANPDQLGITVPQDRLGDAQRTWVRSLSHMQKEAIVVSRRSGLAWRLASDEGEYLQGLDEAPCPLGFFTTGMVAASMNEILALAARRSIAIQRIRLIQDSYYTMKGSMIKGTMRGGAGDVDLEVQIEARADEPTLLELVRQATLRSPLAGLLRTPLESLFALSHNGREIEVTENTALGSALLPDPGDRFAGAIPLDSGPGALVRNTGEKSPLAPHTDSHAGSSLAEHQDRLLHIRGICTLREDGLKEIEQHLYNPRGSIYTLLSEEAPVNGGQGRAPDATTYVAAGLGFCFMTQFGRAAVIFKQPLDQYRIVQDTHFSPGGAAGAAGGMGRAAAVETHCYLESGFDDDYARHVLGMAEQTCFLHALCKSSLVTNVSLADYRE